MSKETVKETANVTETATANETATATAPRIVSQNDAILKAIRNGKSFRLLRRAFFSETKSRTYFNYSMFLILPGRVKTYIQVDFNPDNGYIDKDNKNKKTSSNSTSFQLLNWLYDSGAGLFLKARPVKNEDGNVYTKSGDIALIYSAVCEDKLTGLETNVEIVPSTVANDKFIRLALCGFGGCREYRDEDFNDTPGLKEAFEDLQRPGEFIDD